MALPEKCPSCEYVGAGKGKCSSYGHDGHMHCRRCPDYSELSYGTVQRSTAASGETWSVYCDTYGDKVTVTAIGDPKNRDPPSGFKVPAKMFRTGCRMITVVVGRDDDIDTFVIEEPLLTAASPYFQTALKATFKEGKDSRVELQEEQPSVFGLVNEYLHQASIQSEPPQGHGLVPESPNSADFGEVWLLAHYLQIQPLMNYAMWRIITFMDEGKSIALTDMEDLYARAPVDSILRKVLVHLCVWGAKTELKPSADHAPQDMLRELVTEFQRKCDPAQKSPLMDVRNYMGRLTRCRRHESLKLSEGGACAEVECVLDIGARLPQKQHEYRFRCNQSVEFRPLILRLILYLAFLFPPPPLHNHQT